MTLSMQDWGKARMYSFWAPIDNLTVDQVHDFMMTTEIPSWHYWGDANRERSNDPDAPFLEIMVEDADEGLQMAQELAELNKKVGENNAIVP